MAKPTFKKMEGEGRLLLLAKQKNLPPIIVKMLKEVPHGITVTIDAAHQRNAREGRLPNGFYSFERDRIHITHLDRDVLAHEMGHAKTDVDGGLVSKFQSKYLYPLHVLGPVAGFGGGSFLRFTKHPVARAIAIGVPFLLTVPAMAAEAKASANGHEILKSLGATDEELAKYRRKVALYYLSYAASPATTALTMLHGALL